MGGLRRLNPTLVPEGERRRFTCTTLGCPDEAVLIVPLSNRAERALDAPSWFSDSGEPGTRNDTGPLEMRLCRRCVRTLATALPPGMRLAGAVLRYPELGGTDVAAPETIVGTPEYTNAGAERLLRVVTDPSSTCPECGHFLTHETVVNMDYCDDLMCRWNQGVVRRAVQKFLKMNAKVGGSR